MTTSDWNDFGILLGYMAPLVFLCAWLGYNMWRAGKNDPDPAESAKKWGVIPAILIVVFSYFFFGYLLVPSILGTLYAMHFADTSATVQSWVTLTYVNFAFAVMVMLLQLSMVMGYLWYFGSGFRSLLLNNIKARHFPNALLAYGLYFLVYVVIFAAVSSLIPAINVNQDQHVGFNPMGRLEMYLAFFSLVVFTPLVEELLVRGFLYRALKSHMRHGIAVVLTSGLFAVAHLQLGSGETPLWIAAIDTFVLSVVLIKLVDYSKSLWPAVFVHMIKNGVAFVSLFILSK